MNLDKAAEIVNVFGKALEGKNTTSKLRRKSDLKGFTLSEIDTAHKLILARNFQFTGTPEGDAIFEKTVGSFGYSIGIYFLLFVDDKEFDELEKMDRSSNDYKKQLSTSATKGANENNPEYQKFLQLESIESFGNFCRHVGRDDPLYWQKIYTHLGLRYDPDLLIENVDIQLRNLETNHTIEKKKQDSKTWSKAQVWIYVIIVAITLYFIFK
jgi:hypothetical protein